MKVRAIYLSPGHDFVGRHGEERLDHGIQSVDTVECVAGAGLVGDRYFQHKENYKGQITFFDWAVYERVVKALEIDPFDPSLFRRNVITSGIDLNNLIGKQFELQGITFEGTEECRPCAWMDKAVKPGALDALRGYGGLRARILTDGLLRVEA